MGKIKIIVTSNVRYGKLTTIKEVVPSTNKNGVKRRNVLCKCDCGNEVIINLYSLRNGTTKSCGCLLKELPQGYKRKYEKDTVKTRLYRIWAGIKNRCYNKKTPEYKKYGLRGIIMCDEWRNDFITFKDWSEKNGYNENLTIISEKTFDKVKIIIVKEEQQ